MALFGFQLCFTLIMASFLQKLTPIYSLGRWLLCNGSLVYYKQPTNDELRKLSGKHFEKPKGKRKGNQKSMAEQELQTFKIPKDIELNLNSEQIRPIDSLQFRNYSEYEWLVNYTLFVVLVYIATEIYYEIWTPSKDFNISLVWIALSVSFAVKNMISILRLYLKAGGGEFTLSFIYGILSFICSLCVLMISEDYLDFGLGQELKTSPVSDRPAKFDISGLKLILAFVSALHGMIFAFPGIRMAQMYSDALKYSSGSNLLNFFLHLNFCAPALITLLWIKPLVRDFLLSPGTLNGPRVELLSERRFEVYRIAFVVLICLLRFVLIRHHLQAYLNVAYDRMLKLRKEAGKITNIELRSLVGRVYYYLGVVAMQYLSPIVVHLALACCLKTMGNYSWKVLVDADAPQYLHSGINLTTTHEQTAALTYDSSLTQMISSYDSSLRSYTAVSPTVLRGMFSYFVFWSSANWFMATSLGLFYHSYLAH